MPTFYISGQITGLDIQHARRRFLEAEELLSSMGIDPVNPMRNGLPSDASWEQHLVKDIEDLFRCDGVLMLSNWHQSTGARIEHHVATETGKVVIYESALNEQIKIISTIKAAIVQVAGVPIDECVSRDDYRITSKYYVRLIFAHQCQKNAGMDVKQVAKALNRNPGNVARYKGKYDNEVRVNKDFRRMAEAVESIVTGNVSQ